MIENRRIRFASIDGIERSDLPIAAEVWLDDLGNKSWVTRDMVKLATLFKKHIGDPDPERLSLSQIDRTCQLEQKQVIDSLRLLYIYDAIEGYSCQDNELRASLNLSLLQRLKVLEIRNRLGELAPAFRVGRPEHSPTFQGKWVPAPAPEQAMAANYEEDQIFRASVLPLV